MKLKVGNTPHNYHGHSKKNPKPKKENKMGGHDGILSMNHLGSMEINDNADFLFLSFLVTPSFPIIAIPCHLHLLCIHASGSTDEGL
jgi:hypothetical protein